MHRTSRLSGLLVTALCALLMMTGCFQDAGQGLAATSVAQSIATFTPPPTLELPSPSPEATEEATENIFLDVTPEVTPEIFPSPSETLVELAQGITATPTPSPETFGSVNGDQQGQVVDDPALTATSIIASATARAEATLLALTQVAPPVDAFTPIPEQPIFPTLTPTFDPGQGGGQVAGPVLTGADCVHEVRVGDNLFRLSLYYGLTIDQIAQRNGITNINLIIFRQKLVIPGCGTTGNPPPPTTYPDGQTPGPGTGQSYTVVQGDNLFRISLRYGVPIQSIAAANGIANINLIYVGQVLYIP